MDSETMVSVGHDTTDIGLQGFPIRQQEQESIESTADTRVGDGRHEYEKRHATFFDSLIYINTSGTSHSLSNFFSQSINFNLILQSTGGQSLL